MIVCDRYFNIVFFLNGILVEFYDFFNNFNLIL